MKKSVFSGLQSTLALSSKPYSSPAIFSGARRGFSRFFSSDFFHSWYLCHGSSGFMEKSGSRFFKKVGIRTLHVPFGVISLIRLIFAYNLS